MKIKMTSNFSFAKLLNYIQSSKGFGDTIDRYITNPIIEDSKRKIREDFVTPPTTTKTLRKRRARKFPPTISNSTLYDTGKLHDSIRLSDKRGTGILKNAKSIEFLKYGKYHQFGDETNRQREFIDLSIKNAETASSELMKRMEKSWKKKLAK